MKILILFLGLVAVKVQAETVRFLRGDTRFPSVCAKLSYEQLARYEQSLVVGTEGALAQGFDIELPISGNESLTVQSLLSPRSPLSRRAIDQKVNELSSRARGLYHRARKNGPARGFTFAKEGDASEYLALEYFSQLYPNFIITSGLEFDGPGGRGEVDIVVLRPEDCSVVLIAEVKHAYRQLVHARQQMARLMVCPLI